MGLTRLTQLKNRLQLYYDAEAAVLHGQEYQLGNRRLRRADLSAIQHMIADLENEISTLESGGSRIKRVVFYD